MKRFLSTVALFCLGSLLLQGCGASSKEDPSSDSKKESASSVASEKSDEKNTASESVSEKSSLSESVVTVYSPSGNTVTVNASESPEKSYSPSEKSSPSEESEGPSTVLVKLTEAELYDKIEGGWIGQMAGVTQGAPTEFCYAGKLIPDSAIPKWEPSMINGGFGQDDLYVEIPFLDAMKSAGVDCAPKAIARKFKDSQFALWHANYMGRENLRSGIAYPNSGSYLYNYHADDIDWQIECDFLGMLYPGNVNEAAKRAFELGHIMNYGDGVYGGVFVTAMHSAAFTASSLEEIWQAGVSVIPEGTQFRALIDDVVAAYEAGATFEQNWNMLQTKWASGDVCPELKGISNIDAKLNSGYVLLGLLYGEGDMDKTITLSIKCGQDSDCNPSTAASILGNYYGASGIAEKYKSKLDRDGEKFSYTSYTFNGAVELNFSLMKQMLEKLGGVKDESDCWEFSKDVKYTPVEFEQWPDGVYVYLKVRLLNNTLSIEELTPYSKNEDVVGYTVDMGDGFLFTDVTPAAYTYEKAGTYTVVVTVTGSKGTVTEIKKTVTVKSDLTGKPDDTIVICSVTTPGGGGSKNIDLIRNGVIPSSSSGTDKDQYDTYILGDPHGNPDTVNYIGYIYRESKTVSSVSFTEGKHFNNGGWFKNGQMQVELLIDGKWTKIECTSVPAYPNANSQSAFGRPFETYTFDLGGSYECTGVRIYGIGGGSAGFISCSELDIA